LPHASRVSVIPRYSRWGDKSTPAYLTAVAVPMNVSAMLICAQENGSHTCQRIQLTLCTAVFSFSTFSSKSALIVNHPYRPSMRWWWRDRPECRNWMGSWAHIVLLDVAVPAAWNPWSQCWCHWLYHWLCCCLGANPSTPTHESPEILGRELSRCCKHCIYRLAETSPSFWLQDLPCFISKVPARP
jgi:hypothetical protein